LPDDLFERQLARVLGDGPAGDLLSVLADHPEAACVGGWVRDVLLGRDSDDVDVAAPEPTALVTGLEAMGRVRKTVRLDEERDTWRVVFAGGRYIDVAAFRGADLAEDLRLRDLRINAMAWLPGRGVLDPLDGRADLEARSLRLAGQRALDDDPLRALRLWRFALALEARPAEPLPALDLSAVAPERIRTELERILAHPRCPDALEALHAAGILAQLLPGELRPELIRPLVGGDPAVHRCLEHAAGRPDGLVAVRLGWLCAHEELEEELVVLRWSRRTARAAAVTGVEVGVEAVDVVDDLLGWGDLAAWGLLGRAALADSPEAAVEPHLAALDGAAGLAADPPPVPALPAPVLGAAELRDLLGLEGPAIGHAVRRLVEAQLRGEVRDRESALEWLR